MFGINFDVSNTTAQHYTLTFAETEKCAWKIKSGVIKCTVRVSIKGAVKKENKRIRNDRTRLLPEVRAFHKRYFSLRDFKESKQMVFQPSVIAVTSTSGDHSEAHSKENTTSRYTFPLFGY